MLSNANSQQESAPYPLTSMQQGMLLNTLYSRHSGVDIEQVIIEMNGPVDRAALGDAWQSAINRHEVLRTRFTWEGVEEPQQSVVTPVAMHVEDRVSAPQDDDTAFSDFLRHDRYEGFEYQHAPLMRLTLFQAPQKPDRLVWTFPHALLDGRGIAVLLEEVFYDYDRAVDGHPERCTQTSSFLPFVRWYKAQDLRTAETFWKTYLHGFTSPTPLIEERLTQPNSISEPPIHEIEHLIEGCTITPATTTRLQEAAKAHRCTLHTFIQGAWALLLSRYSGSTDVVFGSTRSCRHAEVPDIERLPGLVINTVPFRVRIDPSVSVLSYLESVRKTQVDLRTHEHTPLEKIQGWSGIARGSRLFESLVVFDHSTIEGVLKAHGGSWRQRRCDVIAKTSFPLTLQVYASPTLRLRFRYARERFSPATIRRMLAHLSTLLENMSNRLNSPLSEIEYLSESERNIALSVWGQGPQVPVPVGVCLHHLVERQVRERPNDLAIIFDGQRITYAELDRRATLIANQLARVPISVEQPIAVILERSPELPIALYGILKAGGCYVPIDPSHPSDRIHYIIERSRSAAVITTSSLASGRSLRPVCPIIRLDAGWDVANQVIPPSERMEASPHGLAYIIFTSGSTGEPKGVMIDHAGAVNTILDINRRFSVGPSDRTLALSAYNFDLSVYDMFGIWAAGGAVVVLHQEETRNPTRWGELVTAEKISIWNSVPALVEMAVEQAAMHSLTFPSIRVVMMSGDWIPVSLPDRILPIMPNALRYSLGGATEASIWSIIHPIESLDPLWSSIPYGRPMDNQAIYVLDARLSPCAPLVPGDIYIGGVGLARGYCGDTIKTNAAFVRHPATGERIYRTGDVGRWHPDGLVEFQGRIDHQVKIRGFRIELGEIETIASTQADLRECVVAVREDLPGQKQLVLYYVPAATAVDLAALRTTLERKLPEYMVPTYYVELASLPLSPNGKVDRRQLPAPQRLAKSNTREPSAFEEQLMSIWKELLQVPTVSLDDSFFELGGNSLLALRFIDRMDRSLAVRTDLATIFSSPTIARLSERLGRADTKTKSIIIPIQTSGSRRPLFFVSGYLDIGRHVGDDQPFYGVDCPAETKMEKPDIPFTQLAKQCIEAMQRIQPKGPYLLGGHCFGAVVAFTMATMLQERGEGVRLLVMMDPPAPASISGSHKRSAHRWQYHLMNFLGRNPVSQARYLLERIRNISNKVINRLRGHNPAVVYNNFVPSLFHGQISMVFAKESYLRLKPSEDPRLAWTNWASSGLEIIETPGDHVTFCREPNVRTLGQALRLRLDQAQKPYTPPVPNSRPVRSTVASNLAFPIPLASEGAAADYPI